MTFARIRLLCFAVAFVGWIAWLGYAVTQRGVAPVVSRAQLIAATDLIVAKVETDDTGLPRPEVTIQQSFRGESKPGETVTVSNLPAAIVPAEAVGDFRTFISGEYFLPLVRTGEHAYRVAGLPRSPGLEPTTSERPPVYAWTADTQAQLRSLDVIR